MHTLEEQPPPGSLQSIAVLVPAWEPEPALVPLVLSLIESGFGAVVLVNDGSHPQSDALFAELAALPAVHLLRHAVNLGKGRALKTGFNFCLAELPHLNGVVTADADGQHTLEDIVHVAAALQTSMQTSARAIVLGVRSFASGVPFRSRFGNTLTRHIFSFVTGTKLADTQTGLRAFPRNLLSQLLHLDGERYEYEMTVLAHLCRRPKPIEIPIQTIYIDSNRSSHFDPVRDSMRIYLVLARFYFSPIRAEASSPPGS